MLVIKISYDILFYPGRVKDCDQTHSTCSCLIMVRPCKLACGLRTIMFEYTWRMMAGMEDTKAPAGASPRSAMPSLPARPAARGSAMPSLPARPARTSAAPPASAGGHMTPVAYCDSRCTMLPCCIIMMLILKGFCCRIFAVHAQCGADGRTLLMMDC